ncbi:MAG: hypothetical protein LBB50_00610 [Oscillospiraceae bacterium]|jgi:hypothetical protein|nr:hypothetical protein [Oscillospiraceae bacterium]
MMNTTEALAELLRLLTPTLNETAFAAVEDDEGGRLCFEGPEGALCIELDGNRAVLLLNEKQLAKALLELETADDRVCKHIADDFAEVLIEKYAKGKKKPGQAAVKKQPPKSISKTAIKNGDAYYDALSFGNAFTSLYPELRGEYKANYERYGEFLAEEFFLEHGNALVLDILRQNNKNNPVQLKRLFGLLNDGYENGVNDVQSLIAVTILGSLNDDVLLASCTDYLSQDLARVVIRVNQYLAKSKSSRQKLKNPPLYKPKKEKKPGLLQQLMSGGGQGGGLPGM